MTWRKMNLSIKILLIVLFSAVVGAIAAVAVAVGMNMTDSRTTSIQEIPTAKPTPSVTTLVAKPPRTRAPETVRTPAPSPAESIQELPPSIATIAPEVIEAVTATPLVSAPETRPPVDTCPSGTVSASLDSIIFEFPYSTLPNEVTVVGRGTLHNGTSAAVQVNERDVPNLEGLNARGQTSAIALYGDYDWAPSPGVPSGGVIVVEPGESVTYTVKDDTLASSIAEVTHWYSSTESGWLQMYFSNAGSLCNVAGMNPGSGKAIPNDFVPRGP